MPQINPKTGKQLSGGAKRAAAKQRTTAYKAGVAAATAQGVTVPGAADFARLGQSPVGNPAEGVAHVNDVLMVALDQVIRHPSIDCLTRWRWIKDFAAVIGMCRDKASEQARIKKLAESMGQVSAAGAPRGAKGLAGISKPTTARRA